MFQDMLRWGYLATWSGEAEETLSHPPPPLLFHITVPPSAKVWKYRNQCFQLFFPSTCTVNLEKELYILSRTGHYLLAGGRRAENFRGGLLDFWENIRGCLHEKTRTARVSYRDDFLTLYRVYMMTGSSHISLFEGTLHVDKIHVWFKLVNITHALPVPVYRQTDVTSKRVVVSRLHDTAARFRSLVKFLPRYKNRGDSHRHGILWWYHVNKYRAMRGNQSEFAPDRKSPRCHVNTP